MIDRIQLIREAHAKVLNHRKMSAGRNSEPFAEFGFDQDRGFKATSNWLAFTQEDVEDEADHLVALDHEKEVDFDHDENEVDMDSLSPTMRAMYS